ncbi:hypothetical protein BN8_06211 [Fibrisoma limi BUZ 3]|uniref:Uncharacterized protein n=1 Tax=Fibrisoma limi BUZ 3 TaxID=1185876 RepID=I2GSE5_9BACT|nr:hypothetical protein BN8_06211 [Fibrisoma limi BUZ 3]
MKKVLQPMTSKVGYYVSHIITKDPGEFARVFCLQQYFFGDSDGK